MAIALDLIIRAGSKTPTERGLAWTFQRKYHPTDTRNSRITFGRTIEKNSSNIGALPPPKKISSSKPDSLGRRKNWFKKKCISPNRSRRNSQPYNKIWRQRGNGFRFAGRFQNQPFHFACYVFGRGRDSIKNVIISRQPYYPPNRFGNCLP